MTGSEAVLIILAWLGMYGSYRYGKKVGRKAEQDMKPKLITPTCPCTHVWGEHKEGGECVAWKEIKRYSGGVWMGYEHVPCVCTVYHGPAIITEEFFNPGTVIQ